MEMYCTSNSYHSIITKINTRETNTNSSTTTRLQVQCLTFSHESGWVRDIILGNLTRGNDGNPFFCSAASEQPWPIQLRIKPTERFLHQREKTENVFMVIRFLFLTWCHSVSPSMYNKLFGFVNSYINKEILCNLFRSKIHTWHSTNLGKVNPQDVLF